MDNIQYVPYFPKNIELRDNGIYDHELDAWIPINQTAREILLLVDESNSVSTIVEHLSKTFKINKEQLDRDVFRMLNELTTNYVVNWKYISTRKSKVRILNFLLQYQKGYKERFTIQSRGIIPIFGKLFLIYMRKIGIFGTLITSVAYLLSVVLNSHFILLIAVYCTVFFAGLISSYSLHESLHIYSYRKSMNGRRLGFIAADLMSIKVIRACSSSMPMLHVILLGPLVPCLLGVSGLLLAFMLDSQLWTRLLAVFFFMYCIHGLYLLPFEGDGKSLLKHILIYKTKKKKMPIE